MVFHHNRLRDLVTAMLLEQLKECRVYLSKEANMFLLEVLVTDTQKQFLTEWKSLD
jgi:hypothetical protein